MRPLFYFTFPLFLLRFRFVFLRLHLPRVFVSFSPSSTPSFRFIFPTPYLPPISKTLPLFLTPTFYTAPCRTRHQRVSSAWTTEGSEKRVHSLYYLSMQNENKLPVPAEKSVFWKPRTIFNSQLSTPKSWRFQFTFLIALRNIFSKWEYSTTHPHFLATYSQNENILHDVRKMRMRRFILKMRMYGSTMFAKWE